MINKIYIGSMGYTINRLEFKNPEKVDLQKLILGYFSRPLPRLRDEPELATIYGTPTPNSHIRGTIPESKAAPITVRYTYKKGCIKPEINVG